MTNKLCLVDNHDVVHSTITKSKDGRGEVVASIHLCEIDNPQELFDGALLSFDGKLGRSTVVDITKLTPTTQNERTVANALFAWVSRHANGTWRLYDGR